MCHTPWYGYWLLPVFEKIHSLAPILTNKVTALMIKVLWAY